MLSIGRIHSFIFSLVFTITVETLVLLIILYFLLKRKDPSWKKIIFAGTLASFSTIPYVWFVFPNLYSWPRSTSLIYSELFAFLIETVIYRVFLRTNWIISFTVSLICNLASYFLGQILRSYGLWPSW